MPRIKNTTGRPKITIFVKIALKSIFFEATLRQNDKFWSKLLKNAPFWSNLAPKLQFLVKTAQKGTFLKQPGEAMSIFWSSVWSDFCSRFWSNWTTATTAGMETTKGARAKRAPPFVVAVSAAVSVVQFDQNLDQKSDQTLDQKIDVNFFVHCGRNRTLHGWK